jgi:hypothetical protein
MIFLVIGYQLLVIRLDMQGFARKVGQIDCFTIVRIISERPKVPSSRQPEGCATDTSQPELFIKTF